MSANEDEVLVPIRTGAGETEFMPVDLDATPSYLVVVRKERAHLLETADPNEDRVFIGGLTKEDAIGKLLMANPKLCYADIFDHMEV